MYEGRLCSVCSRTNGRAARCAARDGRALFCPRGLRPARARATFHSPRAHHLSLPLAAGLLISAEADAASASVSQVQRPIVNPDAARHRSYFPLRCRGAAHRISRTDRRGTRRLPERRGLSSRGIPADFNFSRLVCVCARARSLYYTALECSGFMREEVGGSGL